MTRSSQHRLDDTDYEFRIVGATLQDFENTRIATRFLKPSHLYHPHLREILAAARAIEAGGQTPTATIIHDRLASGQTESAIPFIEQALDNYIPSADAPRLHLFVGRILVLAALRWPLALADRVDSILGNRRVYQGSRIEAAYEAVEEALKEISVEARRVAE